MSFPRPFPAPDDLDAGNERLGQLDAGLLATLSRDAEEAQSPSSPGTQLIGGSEDATIVARSASALAGYPHDCDHDHGHDHDHDGDSNFPSYIIPPPAYHLLGSYTDIDINANSGVSVQVPRSLLSAQPYDHGNVGSSHVGSSHGVDDSSVAGVSQIEHGLAIASTPQSTGVADHIASSGGTVVPNLPIFLSDGLNNSSPHLPFSGPVAHFNNSTTAFEIQEDVKPGKKKPRWKMALSLIRGIVAPFVNRSGDDDPETANAAKIKSKKPSPAFRIDEPRGRRFEAHHTPDRTRAPASQRGTPTSSVSTSQSFYIENPGRSGASPLSPTTYSSEKRRRTRDNQSPSSPGGQSLSPLTRSSVANQSSLTISSTFSSPLSQSSLPNNRAESLTSFSQISTSGVQQYSGGQITPFPLVRSPVEQAPADAELRNLTSHAIVELLQEHAAEHEADGTANMGMRVDCAKCWRLGRALNFASASSDKARGKLPQF